MLYNVNAGNMVIAQNGTVSNAIEVGKANALTIHAPAALTGTVTLYGCDTSDGTFLAVQSGGSDITVPANKATPLGTIGTKFIKVVSGSAEAAARTFRVTMQEQAR